MAKKSCPICTAAVHAGESWELKTPLKETFRYCSLSCLVYGADNLGDYETDSDELPSLED